MFWNICNTYQFPFLLNLLTVKAISMKNSLENNKKDDVIYMSIDHLKEGSYELKILLKNKVMKTVKILKK